MTIVCMILVSLVWITWDSQHQKLGHLAWKSFLKAVATVIIIGFIDF